MWAGIVSAPLAWGFEHIFGWGLSEATCAPGGRPWGIDFRAWVAVITAVTATIAAAGLVAAVLAFRTVKDEAGKDSDPPPGRIWVMSVFGIVLSPIFLTMILLTGAGTLILGHCTQS